MKILIVTHWFYPRNIPRAFRATELYKELKLQGHSVDLVIGDTKKKIKNKDNYIDILGANSSEVLLQKNRKLSGYSAIQKMKKIIEYFFGERYLLSSGFFLYKNISYCEYDAVVSVGLPFYVHLIVALKRKKTIKKTKFISDWGDPFYGDKVRQIAPYFKLLQKYVCSKFDYLITPTENARKYFCEYSSEEKIKVIPQGFNFKDIELCTYKKNNVPTFAYAGIFYLDKRNPTEFLKFLSELDFEYKFIIYTIKHGKIYEEIIEKYEKILKEKLIVIDLIPRLECIKELSRVDFLINIDNINIEQVPSKLIDYSLSQRPILSFTQNNIPKEKFLKFLSGDYENRVDISLENYDIRNVSKKILELMDSK